MKDAAASGCHAPLPSSASDWLRRIDDVAPDVIASSQPASAANNARMRRPPYAAVLKGRMTGYKTI